jgi:putative DNA primase/helicase
MTDALKINMDKNCKGCGEKGASDNGYCLECIAKFTKDNAAEIKKAVEDRVAAEASLAKAKTKDGGPEIDSKFIQQCLFANAVGDGLLFATLFRDRFVYVKNFQEWYEWSGHVWKKDIMNRALAAVDKIAEIYLEEYKRISEQMTDLIKSGADKDETMKLRKIQDKLMERARQLRGDNRRTACLKFAHTIDHPIAVTGEEFDNKPMLFPCANGVIDLETGKLHPGRPDDFLSMASPVEWKGIDEPAPLWEKTLREIFNVDREGDDLSIIEYVQRLFGYSITGLVKEKVFPMLYGKTGWNGRSLIVETISDIMGELAGSIPSEMLLSQKFSKSASGPSPDIMSLKGKRFAFASEIDEGQKFSTAKIKWLTGKDELTGRNPHDKYPTRYKPTHKLFVMTNTQPDAAANDKAFWERMHLIPFDISFINKTPTEPYQRQANLNLDQELKKELSGILAWLVRGCLMWQRDGLNPPKIITEASEEYRRNEDLLADFIDECCIREPGAKEKATKLYARFVTWYNENIGKKEWSGTKFGKQLSQRFPKHKSNGISMYHGIALSDHAKD